MFKKICIALSIVVGIFMIQHSPHAEKIEEVGLNTILFEQKPEQNIHGFSTSNISYTLIQLHTRAAWKDSFNINYQWEELEIIKNIEELTKANVITLLDLAPNKQVALSAYLQASYKALNKWDVMSAYMRQEMEMIKIDMQACIIDKKISDKLYFEAMNIYDQKTMDMALKDSIHHEKCVSEKKIQHNAKTSIVNKLVFYLWLLQKKYDLLFAKQEVLAKNFEVFRDNILPDLNEIRTVLQQYDFE